MRGTSTKRLIRYIERAVPAGPTTHLGSTGQLNASVVGSHCLRLAGSNPFRKVLKSDAGLAVSQIGDE